VRISHGNVIKGCADVHLGDGSLIGAFNWISGSPLRTGAFPNSPSRHPALILGREASITMRHVIDCSDEFRMGDFSVLGGMRTQVLTHALDVRRSIQVTAPIEIGHHTLVFTGCSLLAGAVVPSSCVVAAGAVVTGPLLEEHHLYGGVPAKPIKALSPNERFFARDSGYVV